MAYLPKNKYKVLYTNGNEYRSTKTGKPYTGEYIRLNDGRVFAGNHPSDLKGPLELIPRLRNKNVLTNNINNRVYQILNKERILKSNLANLYQLLKTIIILFSSDIFQLE